MCLADPRRSTELTDESIPGSCGGVSKHRAVFTTGKNWMHLNQNGHTPESRHPVRNPITAPPLRNGSPACGLSPELTARTMNPTYVPSIAPIAGRATPRMSWLTGRDQFADTTSTDGIIASPSPRKYASLPSAP